MLYWKAQCFCTVLCLPSLLWLDANKTCFQPGALLGPQQLLPHLSLQVRVPVAQSLGERHPICRRPSICLDTGKILYSWRQNEATGCYADMPFVQDNMVDRVKMLWRQWGILSTLQTVSNSATAFFFWVFWQGKKESPLFKLVSRKSTYEGTLSLKTSERAPFSYSTLLFLSFFILAHFHRRPKSPSRSFQVALHIYSHWNNVNFFPFIFSSLSQCKPGCEEILISEKTGCFHKTRYNTLLKFYSEIKWFMWQLSLN